MRQWKNQGCKNEQQSKQQTWVKTHPGNADMLKEGCAQKKPYRHLWADKMSVGTLIKASRLDQTNVAILWLTRKQTTEKTTKCILSQQEELHDCMMS